MHKTVFFKNYFEFSKEFLKNILQNGQKKITIVLYMFIQFIILGGI